MARRRRRERPRAADAPMPPVAPAGAVGGQYKPLAEADIVRIVDAAKTVLERTGIEIMPSPCRDAFAKAGCRIDSDRNRVYIDARMIDEALALTPSEVLFAGRTTAHDLNLGGGRVYMGSGGQAVNVLDLNGQVRESRLADNYHLGRLVDRLDHIHFFCRPVVSRDIDTDIIDINQFYASLAATEKHVMANAYVADQVPDLRRLGEILSGGPEALSERPIMSFTNCWTVSPLRYATETVEILDEIVRHGFPVVISSAPQAGATSPAALAGTLVQITAEQLSGFVYVNLISPGHPLVMGCVPAHVDLRTGAYTCGSGEFALMNAACAQIAQHLDVPLYNSSGIPDAKIPDGQAGAEKGITNLAAALAGSNFIHHSSCFLESLLTVAYEQFVIDNDINGAVMRMVRGIEVDEASLSVDVIDDVCIGEGHYLGHAQTLALMNSEYLYPTIMDRDSRDDWEARGSPDIRQTARARAREILAEHWPQIIPPEIDADLRSRFDIRLPVEEMRPRAAAASRPRPAPRAE